ncbi:MAG TPA: hypothetical protein VFN10_22335 [Thermoanaerobaculia bacterium]|nr:hypothetical protein [Thermoanaerobaculia bacterium]
MPSEHFRPKSSPRDRVPFHGRTVERLVRGVAIAVGAFLLATTIANMAGLLPRSEAMPPVRARVTESLKTCLVGLALVIPYLRLRSRTAKELGVVGIGITLIWAVMIGAGSVIGYVQGRQSWPVIALTSIAIALVVANAFVFRKLTKPRPLNDTLSHH